MLSANGRWAAPGVCGVGCDVAPPGGPLRRLEAAGAVGLRCWAVARWPWAAGRGQIN